MDWKTGNTALRIRAIKEAIERGDISPEAGWTAIDVIVHEPVPGSEPGMAGMLPGWMGGARSPAPLPLPEGVSATPTAPPVKPPVGPSTGGTCPPGTEPVTDEFGNVVGCRKTGPSPENSELPIRKNQNPKQWANAQKFYALMRGMNT